MLCHEVVSGKVVTKFVCERWCGTKMVCDRVVGEKWCVATLCVTMVRGKVGHDNVHMAKVCVKDGVCVEHLNRCKTSHRSFKSRGRQSHCMAVANEAPCS